MPFFHHILRVEMESRFLALPVEIMEDAQLFLRVQFGAFGTEQQRNGKLRSAPTRAKYARASSISFFTDRDGEVFFLHDPICRR